MLRQRLSAPPHHLDTEVASTVRGLAAGKKKITDHRDEQTLADCGRLRITRHPVWPYHPRMWELRHNLGAYIALAEALGRERLTGCGGVDDEPLVRITWYGDDRDVERQHPDLLAVPPA